MTIRRRILAQSVALTLAVSGLSAVATTPAGAATSGDLTSGSDCVQTSTLQKVDAISATGAVVAPTVPGNSALAQRYTYTLNGSSMTEIVPPSGWSPIAATDTELRTYHFPARPTDPAALSVWTARFAHFKGVTPAGLCTTRKYNNQSTGNWAGAINTGSGFITSSVSWTQPSFQGVCPSASAYSIWSGISSSSSSKLMQAGTDTTQGGLNGNYAFWEMIAPGHNNPEMKWLGSAMNTGDIIFAGVVYSPNDNPADVYFFVQDETSGGYWDIDVTSKDGAATSSYWDGSVAEAISESPSGGPLPGGYYNLRRPNYGYNFTSPMTNSNPMSHYSYYAVDEARNGHQIQTSNFNGGTTFANAWNSCGT